MIYSGDMSGYIRKNSKDVVDNEFLLFLKEKFEQYDLTNADDADEREVIGQIIVMIEDKFRQTDGLVDSTAIFESRLDKILFAPPNQRKNYIQETVADMTEGFVEYVQKELRSSPDTESKVVLATILQLIGQVKQIQLDSRVESDMNILLKQADSTLGEQFTNNLGSTIIEGGLAETTATLRSGGVKVGERNEQILASLMFSSNDILEDVLNNLHEINDDFVQFLQDKIDVSKDMDERVGLGSLKETINSVLLKVKEMELEQEALNVKDEELSLDQVKMRMKEIQAGQESGEDASNGRHFGVFAVKQDNKETFRIVLQRFQNLPEDMSLTEAVEANYDLCDYKFMETLEAEAAECMAVGAHIEAAEYQQLQSTISAVMAARMSTAQQKLEKILARRDPKAMESEVAMMTRRGEVDEALVLLIEANVQQAQQAGATQVAEVLTKLSKRIVLEKERKLPDEQRLLRALLRLNSTEERKGLLYEAFKQVKTGDAEGRILEGAPLIAPPIFINIVRSFIQSFGNVDGFDIMGRAQLIIDEAQIVATELYGESMTPRDQQKFMFEKQTISVWDLADFEDKALMSGEEVPWRNDKFDRMSPEDVLGERVQRIGGEQ